MATLTPVGVGKSESLINLNTIVDQNEDQLGPLIAIGNDGSQTVLTFDMDQNPPAKHAVIVPAGGALPPGSTVICQGKVFITGQLTDATSIRPT